MLNQNKLYIPSQAELEHQAELVPEIDVAAVSAMFRILQAAERLQHAVLSPLEREYRLSAGKLSLMLILYNQQRNVAPSELAKRMGVSRPNVSAMLRRMNRDGLTTEVSDAEDGRAKKIALTDRGMELLAKVLPEHYQRINKIMSRVSQEERHTIVMDLEKLADIEA